MPPKTKRPKRKIPSVRALSVADGWAFCPACGNAVTKTERELARCDYECARCGGSKLSSHYSLGSDTHMGVIEAWKRGTRTATNWHTRGRTVVNVIPPMAWPNTESSSAKREL